jgi:beta-fructofuranosidase
VTADTTSSAPAVGTRPRPRIHFTADDGWINDPYGVAWIGGRYHLYYQAIPGRVTWAPDCHWGHARSDDLVHWDEQPLALVPQDFEVGCWSGSVVDETDPPTIFYTRVSGDDWEIGQVATATFDKATNTWRTRASDVVIDAPPASLRLRSFRDPNVFRDDQGWKMLMAASLPDDSAAVLQYSSQDLRHWAYDGILCSRPNNHADEVPTGALWECPQLFLVGDRWVLIVSVWDEQELLYVAAALGSYDGRTFEPATWQRLTYGASAYAMTAFLDRDGRRCVMSWLREEPRNNDLLTERAGAHSIVSTLTLGRDDMLVLQPHPDVDTLPGTAVSGHSGRYDVGDSVVDLTTTVSAGLWCDIVEDGESRLRLFYDPGTQLITLDRPGFPTDHLPLPHPATPIRLLLDADIVELFTTASYGAYRIAPAHDASATTIELAGDNTTTNAAVRRLT